MATAAKRRRPPLTVQERDQRRAEERALMQASVDALMTSDGWQRWLRVRRHFSRYSLRNQLLIAQQCPNATYVASFQRPPGPAAPAPPALVATSTPRSGVQRALDHRPV